MTGRCCGVMHADGAAGLPALVYGQRNVHCRSGYRLLYRHTGCAGTRGHSRWFTEELQPRRADKRDRKAVSRWLGHKSIEVTHQIYGHFVPASWDRARAVLDDACRPGQRQAPENRC